MIATVIRKVVVIGVMMPIVAMGSTVAAVETTTAPATTTAPTSTLGERVAARKTALKTKLTTAESAKIKLKCKAAQGLVSSISGRVNGVETSRLKVYENLLTRMTAFNTKLSNQGADTTTLTANITALKLKVETFESDMTEYKTAVADLSILDCVGDPTGFKATLDTARIDLVKVSADSLAIKTYVNDTVKPTLKDIRSRLVSGSESTDTTQSQKTKAGAQ